MRGLGRMAGARVVIGAMALLAWCDAAGAAETAWRDVTVRVYDNARVSERVTQAALDVAGKALAPASIDVSWLQCPTSSGGRCLSPLGRTELMVRFVRAARPSRGVTFDALGDARVDERTGSGVLATVYIDRVEELARAARVDAGMLLGRALAHELGHLLMGGLHSVSGLMRPAWTREEVQRNATADWVFAGGELLAMRAGAERF